MKQLQVQGRNDHCSFLSEQCILFNILVGLLCSRSVVKKDWLVNHHKHKYIEGIGGNGTIISSVLTFIEALIYLPLCPTCFENDPRQVSEQWRDRKSVV